MKLLNAGVIGTGFIGPLHIEALRRLGFVKVKGIADINEDAAKKKSAELYLLKYYVDYKELLADDEIDVVHVCTPDFLHYQMVKDALNAGKHVICEKPLTLTSSEAYELIDLAKQKNLCHALHFNLRFYPLLHEMKHMVQSGELGEIFAVGGSYLQDWLFYETDYNWRLETFAPNHSRAVADIGSHWLDCVEFVTDLSIKRVCADCAIFHPVRKKPLKPIDTYSGKILSTEDYQDIPIKTEDYASILLRFDNNAHGVFTVNQMAAGRKNRMYIELFGSKKAVAFDSEQPNLLWIGRRDGRNEQLIRDPSLVSEFTREIITTPGGHNEGFPETSKQLFKKFYSYIIKGDFNIPPPFPTFENGLRELIICEKIIESSQKEAWVEV